MVEMAVCSVMKFDIMEKVLTFPHSNFPFHLSRSSCKQFSSTRPSPTHSCHDFMYSKTDCAFFTAIKDRREIFFGRNCLLIFMDYFEIAFLTIAAYFNCNSKIYFHIYLFLVGFYYFIFFVHSRCNKY